MGAVNKRCVYSGIATENRKAANTTAKQHSSLLGSSTEKVQITHIFQRLYANPRFSFGIAVEKSSERKMSLSRMSSFFFYFKIKYSPAVVRKNREIPLDSSPTFSHGYILHDCSRISQLGNWH